MNHKAMLWSSDHVDNFSVIQIELSLQQKAPHFRKTSSAEMMAKIIRFHPGKKKSLFIQEVICSAAGAKHSLVPTFRPKIFTIESNAYISHGNENTVQSCHFGSRSCDGEYPASPYAAICHDEPNYCRDEIADISLTMGANKKN